MLLFHDYMLMLPLAYFITPAHYAIIYADTMVLHLLRFDDASARLLAGCHDIRCFSLRWIAQLIDTRQQLISHAFFSPLFSFDIHCWLRH